MDDGFARCNCPSGYTGLYCQLGKFLQVVDAD